MNATAAPTPTLRSLFVTSAVATAFAVIYQLLGMEPPNLVVLFIMFAPSVSAVLWLRRDARLTRIQAITDWGWFALTFYPVVIPWYLLKTRGRRGWRTIAWIALAILAPFIAAFVVWLLQLTFPSAAKSWAA